MSNAQSAEMVFSTNRAEMPVSSAQTTRVTRAARLDLATSHGPGQDEFQAILDRIEQLEFALAEAVLRSDVETQPDLGPALGDIATRVDAMARTLDDLAARAKPENHGNVGEVLDRIADRLDAAAASRADDTAMLAARLTAIEAGAETRFAPIEAAVTTLASQVQETMQGFSSELERLATSAAEDRSEIKTMQASLRDQIAALPQPVDVTDDLERLAGQIASLPQPTDISDELATIEKKIARLDLDAVTHAIGKTDAALKDQVDALNERLSTMEATLSARVAHMSEAAQTLANRPVPAPDIAPLREMTARHMVAQKSIADRHAAQIAQLADRFAKVEAGVQALPDRTTLAGLKTDIGGALEKGRQPLVTRMDALTGMLATLANDVKLSHEMAPDLSLITEPLMARMDRLDTTAEQRQRELAREVEEIGARPQPVTDLTPMRESFARLMVALQSMQQNREGAEAEMADQIKALTERLQGLPDRMEASADQRQRDMIREVEALAARPIPAPDLTPVRETMARFMVALKTMEESRSSSDAEFAAKIDLLAEQINELPTAASPEDLAKVQVAMAPLQAALATMGEQVKHLAARPAPTLDISTVRGAFSQQMVAISTWMKRQDVLQSAMSDLLETLVEQGADKSEQNALSEALKTMISAHQFTARKQLEAAEERLSEQLAGLAQSVGHVPFENDETETSVTELCEEDQRLLDALNALRQIIAETPIDDETGLLEQTRDVRLAFAETLASIQAGQAVRI